VSDDEMKVNKPVGLASYVPGEPIDPDGEILREVLAIQARLSDRYYVIRVSPYGRADPDVGPSGPMSRADALAAQTAPDPVSGWLSLAVGPLSG
jgi:hypothetical protein